MIVTCANCLRLRMHNGTWTDRRLPTHYLIKKRRRGGGYHRVKWAVCPECERKTQEESNAKAAVDIG